MRYLTQSALPPFSSFRKKKKKKRNPNFFAKQTHYDARRPLRALPFRHGVHGLSPSSVDKCVMKTIWVIYARNPQPVKWWDFFRLFVYEGGKEKIIWRKELEGTSKKKITCEVGVKNIEMVLPGGCVMGVEEWNAGVWWALVKNNIERTTSSLDTKKKSDVWPRMKVILTSRDFIYLFI